MAIENQTRIIQMRGTMAACESFVANLEEVVIAYATDIGQLGIYTNGAWLWMLPEVGAGRLLFLENVTNPPVPVTSENGQFWLVGE